MSIESLCFCEFPVMVGIFEDAFWAWEVCDFEVLKVVLGFIGVNMMGVVGWVSKRKVWRSGSKCPNGSITRG